MKWSLTALVLAGMGLISGCAGSQSEPAQQHPAITEISINSRKLEEKKSWLYQQGVTTFGSEIEKVPLDFFKALKEKGFSNEDLVKAASLYEKITIDDLVHLYNLGFGSNFQAFVMEGGTVNYAEAYLAYGMKPSVIEIAKRNGFTAKESDMELIRRALLEYHWDWTFQNITPEDQRKVLQHDPNDHREVAVIIFPKHNPDQAFQIADHFYSHFISQYKTFVFEIATEEELYKAIETVGKKHQISLLIDNGHGKSQQTVYSIHEKEPEKGMLDISDEKEMKKRGLAQYFTDDSKILALSCSNGAPSPPSNLLEMRSRVFSKSVVIGGTANFRIDNLKIDVNHPERLIEIYDDSGNNVTVYYQNGILLAK